MTCTPSIDYPSAVTRVRVPPTDLSYARIWPVIVLLSPTSLQHLDSIQPCRQAVTQNVTQLPRKTQLRRGLPMSIGGDALAASY